MIEHKANKFSAKDYFLGRTDEDEKYGYIILAGGDVRRKVICNRFLNKDKSLVVRDVDGCECTAIRCRKKFLGAIFACKKFTSCYSALLQVLSANDIKEFFYEIWIANHNCRVAADQTRRISV